MKLIVAGSRTVRSYNNVKAMLDHLIATGMPRPTEIVSGGASGADMLGEHWAKENGIPIKLFPANWNANGKAAGPIRNRAMAEYADAAVCFWDGESRGTKNMIAEMERLEKTCKVVSVATHGDWPDDIDKHGSAPQC